MRELAVREWRVVGELRKEGESLHSESQEPCYFAVGLGLKNICLHVRYDDLKIDCTVKKFDLI